MGFTTAEKKKASAVLKDPRAERGAMNQSQFWGRFGVTQSGGSRYENERDAPIPLRVLMALDSAGKLDSEDLADALAVAKKF